MEEVYWLRLQEVREAQQLRPVAEVMKMAAEVADPLLPRQPVEQEPAFKTLIQFPHREVLAPETADRGDAPTETRMQLPEVILAVVAEVEAKVLVAPKLVLMDR